MNSAKWRMGCLAALTLAAAGAARGETHTVTADATYSHYVEYSHLGSVEHTYDIRVPAGTCASIRFAKVKYEDGNADRSTRKLRLYENGALHSLTGVADDTYDTIFYENGTIRINTEIGPTYYKEAIWGQNSLGPYIIAYQTIYYKAYYTRQHYTLAVAYAPSSGPPPVPVVPHLDKITISGSSVLYPGGNTNYTCTATMDDGTTKVVNATWSIQSAPAGRVSINASTGRLDSEKFSDITSPIPVVIAATYTENGITRRDTFEVTILVPPRYLVISGPSEVASGRQAAYTCTLLMADGQTTEASPTWSISSGSSYATIGADGVLTAKSVSSPSVVTVCASQVVGQYHCKREKAVTNMPAVPLEPEVSVPTRGERAVSGSITVTWTGGGGATSFHVYRSGTGERPESPIKTKARSPYMDNDAALAPGATYHYWVEARSPAGSSFGTDWGNRAATLGLGAETVAAGAGGGKKRVAVKSNTGWKASSGEAWIHVATGAGTGNGAVEFTVDANGGGAAREGMVTVVAAGGTSHPKTAVVTVVQDGEGGRVERCEVDGTRGAVRLQFPGKAGRTYLVERTRALGEAWATERAFTATNDGVNEVAAGIPGTWQTGFFRVGAQGGEEADPDPEPESGGWTATNRYLVVDMSGGPGAASWPVSGLEEIPEGRWPDEYKMSKLVLRRIEAGTFTMGSPEGELGRSSTETQHAVTLTKPYYMGVFEVTQKQWELAMGLIPPTKYPGATRPVEMVNYDAIRGAGAGTNWPTDGRVDQGSFLDAIREKTGLAFDLPTEAQWEYVCRAGTGTALNSGKDLTGTEECPNMGELGKYGYNSGFLGPGDGQGGYERGTAIVGSYPANAWGLHDMHGNVDEWCLDWYGSYVDGSATDPAGADSGSYRVLRGGGWNQLSARYCRSARRGSSWPSSDGSVGEGFRLCCPAGMP